MHDPTTLISEVSPLGNAEAHVEDDGQVVYFYLEFPSLRQEESSAESLRACWVRNRAQAPRTVDQPLMAEGHPPMMPRRYCSHPDGAPALEPSNLRIVWFEEGDGAALMEVDEPLAIIPPWSGQNGFYGYARDCVSKSPFAWPLSDDNELHQRVRRAEEYWSLWDDESFWRHYSTRLIEALEAELGPHDKYFAIDGNEWPPKALLRFDHADRYLLVTVGVSLLPQPQVECHFDDPGPVRRIELAAAIDRNCPVDEVTRMGSYISGQSRYPWSCLTWFGEGHTIPCDSVPEYCGGRSFPAVLLTSHLSGTPGIRPPAFRDDPINVLWLVPITDSELKWATVNGSAKLVERLNKSGITVTMRRRAEITLDSP